MSEEIDDISQDALTFIGLVAAEKLKKPGADTLFEIVTRQGKTHTFTSMEHHHGDLVVIEGGLGNGYPVQQGGPNPRLWIKCSEIISFQTWQPNPDYQPLYPPAPPVNFGPYSPQQPSWPGLQQNPGGHWTTTTDAPNTAPGLTFAGSLKSFAQSLLP